MEYIVSFDLRVFDKKCNGKGPMIPIVPASMKALEYMLVY